jgi:hypothetical protein
VLLVKNPLIIIVITIFISLITCLITWTTASKWIGYAVFLIFLGGIIIIFLYTRILSGNDKVILPQFTPYVYLILLPLIRTSHHSNISLYSPFTLINFNLIVFLVLFLLITLLLLTKLIEPSKGTLIKKF